MVTRQGDTRWEYYAESYNREQKALFIDTDYVSPDPRKKQFEILNIIRSQVKRYYNDKFTIEVGGCYTGVFAFKKMNFLIVPITQIKDVFRASFSVYKS